ncbi:AI-2E family transporter [Phenylobacterium sp. J426]|uniref:AI-2E family transporter n=1 Tax=Phenylobacterium sp. J426 TaxID=2898439 RepID=UPI002150A767|nr:AI-2E family transporter [Phenylobacterium sp. J426]MCR5876169.1 AI-2E family transporter [Phenylobacterium sp. J426]
MGRVAIAGALVVLALLVLRLADVLLLAFGSVLTAVLLHALADPLVRRASMPRPWALFAAVVGLVLATAATLWLFGREAAIQLAALSELIPRAWRALELDLSRSILGAYILDDLRRLQHADGLVMQLGPRLIRDSATAAAAALIVMFAGLYLAFHPRTYLGGLVRLTPRSWRARTETVLLACGAALNRWLVGQLISMLLVGVTTGVGLWLAGVPSPLALGVVAGLGQFVPVIGPMVSTIPGLILAASAGWDTLAWTAVVYIGAMQLEANLFTPLVLRQMVELPMAVTLFAVLAMGVLLGPLGVLFATPLAVVVYVVVRMVYVEDVLGDRSEA